MNRRVLALLALLPLLLPSAATSAQATDVPERVTAAFFLALGRPPTSAEAGEWNALAKEPLTALLARHQDKLEADTALQQAVAAKAAEDALGRKFADGDPAKGTYSRLIEQHLKALKADPDAYRKVIARAYPVVIGRAAFDLEYDYWKARDPIPFVLLVGAIEHWTHRNQPGLMATTGMASIMSNSRLLTTARLSREVAYEARPIVGIPSWVNDSREINPGNYIIAVGARDVASVGGIHFLVAGGPGLVAN